MAMEPPTLDHHTAPVGPAPERSPYVRREDEHGNLLRSVIALLFAVCGGLAAVFLFFVDTIRLKTDLGLQAAGLAAWCAAGVAWARARP